VLSDTAIEELTVAIEEHGGLISYRTESDGTESPYEINCSYIDALTHPDESDLLRIKRMLLSQGTALAMPGVPGIYFHSLVGSRNYHDGVKHTGINRAINREKYNVDWLESELSEQGSLAKTMLDSYKRLISIRSNEAAFNPFGMFRFYDLDPRLFVIEQRDISEQERVLALHNFSDEAVTCALPEEMMLPMNDLLSPFYVDTAREVTLEPYQMMWLKGRLNT
jgi:sucrose phosphorylase